MIILRKVSSILAILVDSSDAEVRDVILLQGRFMGIDTQGLHYEVYIPQPFDQH